MHLRHTISLIWWIAIICSMLYIWYMVSREEKDHSSGTTTSWTIQNSILFNNNDEVKSIHSILCKKYKKLCSIIKYEWIYIWDNKETYWTISMYFIKKLDTILWDDITSRILKKITISSQRNNRRAYATHNTMFFHIPWISYREYMMVLTHELWHIIDLSVVLWSDRKKSSLFTEFDKEEFSIDDPSLTYYKISWENEHQKKSTHTKEAFCSIYGMSNPFEDFAECFQLYMNHNQYFRTIISNNSILTEKYLFIDKLLDGKYFYNKLQSIEAKESHRHRDTTRMR